MKRVFSFMLLSLLFIAAKAQQIISSVIIDASTNQPLYGATVSIGAQKVTTDVNGAFKINCDGAKQITISFIGYKTAVLAVTNCKLPATISLASTSTLLESVEVSGSTNKATLYQPAAISKINMTELNRGTGLFLDDAIQTNMTGVIMNRRSVAGGQQFNIRGYGNGTRGTRGVSSNFDGQGYKVYFNGIALTDAEGITTFDDIDYGSLQQVEVIKGPAGSQYGLAIAGVVNISTRKAEKNKTSLSQQVLLGNYGLKRFTTTLQAAGDKSSLLLMYGKQSSDGYTIHNASKKDFVSLVADFQPTEKQTISTFLGYSNSYDERAGELTIAQYEGNDYSGNIEYIKRDAHSKVITYRAGTSHSYVFNRVWSNTTSLFGTAFNSNAASASGTTDKATLNVGLRSVFNTNLDLGNGISLKGATGIETQKQVANTMGYSMKKDPKDTTTTWTYGRSPYWVLNAATSNVFTDVTNSHLFTEWTLSLPKAFSITAGIGTSRMNIYLNDRFNTSTATKPDKFEKTYKDMVSPHIAINKVISDKISIFASYSKAYKAPVSSYFFISTPAVATTPATPATAYLNEVLKPEIGNQFEIGTKGQLFKDKFQYELVYFNTVFSNKMTAVSVPSPLSSTTTLYSYVVNGGKQIHKGIEASLRVNAYESKGGFVRSFRPFTNLTYSDFKYGSNFTIQKSVTVTEDYSNKAVAAVSKYVFNVGIDLNFAAGFYANITYNYRDKMPITSLNDVYTTSYNLLNGKLGYSKSLGKHWNIDLSAGVANATNTKYFIMVFANQLPDAYVPAARNAQGYGSAMLKYNF
ncbi:MAG: TonB-dependent receptor [Chitinophagaceae bacterium]|nr:TonB-dependent receptor [Chitinophagaceae bacterium]